MCGIAGVYYFDAQASVDPGLLQRMTDLLVHRGPDDGGYYCQGNVGLGHRRLAILDLSSAGHQPMSNADGSLWITYNGECYNYRDFHALLRAHGHQLRSTSDTETLLYLYADYGPAFLEKIAGMYALGLWDARRQRLLLARDRLGIKPLFYYYDRQHLVFASELKALLADPTIPTTLNHAALSDFLHLMSIPDPESIFQGVKKLLPGQYLLAEKGRVRTQQYWEIPVAPPDEQRDLTTLCEQFDRLWQRTVASHMIADVPVGAFLSGGVDSSAIVAMASRQHTQPMLTFASTFRGLAEFDESPYAQQVAALCHTQHHEFNLTPDLVAALPRIAWHADEPLAISSAFALYFLSQLARQHVKVVLTGDGGDEVFAGYPWRHADFSALASPVPSLPQHVPSAFRHWLGRVKALARTCGVFPALKALEQAMAGRLAPPPPSDTRYVQSFLCYQEHELAELLLPDVGQTVQQAWADNITQRYYDHCAGVDQLTRKLYTDIKTTLVSEMLTKVDRMTMAFGLEARVPFLDHQVVEWAFGIPSASKLHGMEGKYVVKKAMERYLPADVLYRPKHGFNVPMKVWMRDQLATFIRDTLNERAIRSRGMFRAEHVSKILQAHAAGQQDASNKIIVMMMLELWFQRFVDKRHELYGKV